MATIEDRGMTGRDVIAKTFTAKARRGYEPVEVDSYLEQVGNQIDALRAEIARLEVELSDAQSAASSASSLTPPPPVVVRPAPSSSVPPFRKRSSSPSPSPAPSVPFAVPTSPPASPPPSSPSKSMKVISPRKAIPSPLSMVAASKPNLPNLPRPSPPPMPNSRSAKPNTNALFRTRK